MRRGMERLFYLVVISMVFLGASVSAGEDTENKTLSPYFFIEGGNPSVDHFPLKETDVRVSINGVIADVVVRQKYSNEGTRPINARYIFPASTQAAVHGMKMIIGDRIITAKIKEKEAAKKEFEEAKSAGKSASLLSQSRPNVFSMNVANIMPKDAIDIELHYTELLVPFEGVYEFVYPTVVGPRYSSQSKEGAPEDDRWVENPYLKEGSRPKSRFNVAVALSAGMALQDVTCKSHQTDILFKDTSNASISLKESEFYGGNRDFILDYRLAGGNIQTGMMLFEKDAEKFFLLMVQPPKRIKADDILPREYIFVVDVSGSMSGYPLEVSKELLRNLIGGLKPADKFNVILFSGASHIMSPTSLPATQANIQKAIEVIDSQKGGGGTELLAALNRALSIPRDKTFSRSVLIVTDGYISAEKEVFDTIRKNLDNTNAFSFGIGTGVNRYLIEGIAKAGMGEPFIVTEQKEAPEAAGRFCDYVRSPLLRNIKLKFEGFKAYDIEPKEFPDLFAERPIVVIGKWHGKAEGSVTISGNSASGEYRHLFNATETKPLESNSALRYLWARTRIARLSDYSSGPEDPEVRKEILSLGLTYSLLTQYTSFIAVHDVIRNEQGSAKDVTQPLPLPKGVSNLAVGCSVSQVPEPDLWVMAIIAALLFSSVLLYRRIYWRISRIERKGDRALDA